MDEKGKSETAVDLSKTVENLVGEFMGDRTISKNELKLMMFKKWFTILVNILVKVFIGLAVIPLTSGITKKIFTFIFILWIGKYFIDKFIDWVGRRFLK